LENLPVDIPPLNSLPYGGKLHFTIDLILLLLPVSTMESPNIRTAGIVSLPGMLMTASTMQKTVKAEKIKKNVVDIDTPFIFKRYIARDCYFWDSSKFESKQKKRRK
jgi:hypothetical protein